MFNRYFNYEPKKLGFQDNPITVFKYESSPLIENFPCHYLPKQFIQDTSESSIDSKPSEIVKVLLPSSGEIVDYQGIPSSTTILQMESSGIEDLRSFK